MASVVRCGTTVVAGIPPREIVLLVSDHYEMRMKLVEATGTANRSLALLSNL